MPESFWTGYLVRLAVVALVLIALYFTARKLRQTRLFGGRGRCLSLLESIILSQHAALHVVRVGARYFLIGSATGTVTALAEIARGDAVYPERCRGMPRDDQTWK
jgi:flagellar biogenesis protein FliO